MTNLERLKLELAHRQYFSDEEYKVFLDENGLMANLNYNRATDELFLLQTVVAILQALSNNIDYFRTIQTEFSDNTSAYRNLKDRIDQLNKRIAMIPTYEADTKKTITYMFSN